MFVFCLLLFGLEPVVAVAKPASGNGISVTPVLSQIQLHSGQTQLNLKQTVTNISRQLLVISAHAQDFSDFGDNGAINFYPTPNQPSHNPHGLASHIKLSKSQFGLPPGISQVVNVTIDNVSSMAAGGHYGAVVYSAVNPESTNNANVSLVPSVASLIFLSTASGGTQKLQISNLQLGRVSLSLPQSTSLVIANSGNTQSTPIGYISLLAPGNGLLAQSVLNNSSLMVLPDSSQLFNVNLQNTKNFWALPGIYDARIVYGYSGSKQLAVYNFRFLYLNPMMLLIVILLIIAASLFIYHRVHKKYKYIPSHHH